MKKIVFRHQVEDSVLLFIEHNGLISLYFVPLDMENMVDLSNENGVDAMIQVSLLGDIRFACYSSGQTMRNSETTNSFRLKGQKVTEAGGKKIIKTTFVGNKNVWVENIIIFDAKTKYVKTYNILKNNSLEEITVEMFASFSLSGLSPFVGNVPEMKIHRMFGNWSAEGRPECRKIETSGLEQSWANYGLRNEKFGSIGSMPIQRYFPFMCLEDCNNNTLWGVLMEAPYSWQMEISRYNRYLSISGGQADYEYGHVATTVKPGKKYVSTAAYITVCHGSIDEIYNRLRNNENNMPLSSKEGELPVLYNEYCDSWGGPSHDKVIQTAKFAKECGAEYFVIDAGWYCDSPDKWSICIGDFIVENKNFPHGIAETAKKIREIGLIPGIWFEFECVATQSEIFKQKDMFLTKNGKIICSGNRAFLDFRKKKVRKHLRNTVIDFLKDNGFGYIKIDYNECIGIGCDGEESYGMGLKKHIDGVLDFLKEIREAIPNIIIESCASGGHRIEQKFLSLADMTSFSDAHEGYEGAIVASNVNKLCPSRKNQIWAVVNNGYSIEGIRYSMAKTLFGRMCLSGNLKDLTEDRLTLVKRFTSFYKNTCYILKSENSYHYGNTDLKYLDLYGEQAVFKIATNESGALIVVHGFKDSKPITISHKGLANYKIVDVICSEKATIERNFDDITIFAGDFDACVIHLTK